MVDTEFGYRGCRGAGVFFASRAQSTLLAMAGAGDDEGSEFFPELLSFVRRAQTLISDTLAVSRDVPREFLDPRYERVLFDLRYLDCPDELESNIRGNREMRDLDDELRESCSSFLQRFFDLASCIVTYHDELFKYLDDLQGGFFVQYKLEKILENKCGRQLLTESISYFGCLLLLMEHQMSGLLREKLLVAHLRYDHCFDVLNLESICNLCRLHPHSFSPNPPRHVHTVSFIITVNRPEELFARFPFPKKVVDAVISRVRDDDLYCQLQHYPDPQHRPVALSAQAGCLYVLLWYSAEVLHNGFVMREIVDRFFRNCWVCPIFAFYSVDLLVSWDAYREAKMALSSYLPLTYVRDCTQLNCTKVKEVLSELDLITLDGALTKNYVFRNSQTLLSLIRICNVVMRWLVLHKSSMDKKYRDAISSILATHQIGDEFILSIFLKICKVEFEVKRLYSEILGERDVLWEESKHCASDCLKEVALFFSSSRASSYKMKSENLEVWFGKLVLEVNSLDYLRAGNSGKKIDYVLSALKEVEQLHQVEENQKIRRNLSEVQRSLHDMLKALSVADDTMSALTVVTDSVYAWSNIDKFVALLKKKIEEDASSVLILHCFFLKFQHLLVAPLSRIQKNKDSIPSFYMFEYVSHVHSLLSIIPYENQFHLMETVNTISIFSQGLQLMSRNSFGPADLDVNNFLESQILKELSGQLEHSLKSFFPLNIVESEELEMRMRRLTAYVVSQRHAMKCLQDLLHVCGDYMWEEAFANYLKYSAEEEASGFIRRSQDGVSTMHQLNNLSGSQTFLGRLLRQMLFLSSPPRSMFLEPMSGWFDSEGNELIGLHFFDQLKSFLGVDGMASLDSLLYDAIKVNLESVLTGLERLLDSKILEELCKLDVTLGHASLPVAGSLAYRPMLKIITLCEPWVETLASIGQLQLLRHMIALKLKALLEDEQGTGSGFSLPFRAIYMCKDSPLYLCRFMSIVTISQLSQYMFDSHLGTLTCRGKKATLDSFPFAIGLGTFLNQFHPKYVVEYLQYMGQYVRSVAETSKTIVVSTAVQQRRTIDPASEVTKSTFWLMNFCKHMEIPKDVLDSCIPPSLFTVLQI